MPERLHKFLAHCGVASRRKAEALIVGGRVSVNGETVTEMGVKIIPGKDNVAVDGRKVKPEKNIYYLLNKPRHYTTTVADEHGGKIVMELLPDMRERVYPVGRLDRDSEGLLVLTNDGDVAFYLTHPRCAVTKTYMATVEGQVTADLMADVVANGRRLGPLFVKPLAARVVRQGRSRTQVEIIVGEGINREIRRLFAALGHEVYRLVRIRIGPLSLGGLKPGKVRPLATKELSWLRRGMKKLNLDGKRRAAGDLQPTGGQRCRRGRSRLERGNRLGKPDPARAIKGGKLTVEKAGRRRVRSPAGPAGPPAKPQARRPAKRVSHPLGKKKK